MTLRSGSGSGNADAIVVGSGPNGLVAANILADAGWDVVVYEEQSAPGGGVRSADYLGSGFSSDVCSAFYPLAAASPALVSLHLEDHGLEWTHAPTVLAHPLPDGRCAVLYRGVESTADAMEALSPGDGEAWARLSGLWDELGPNLLDAVFAPFPPVRSGVKLAAKLRSGGILRLARFATLPVRRLAEEEFTGPGAMLLAGCSLHTDLSPESAGSSVFGWLLAMLGQQHGFPVPVGGAGKLTDALVRRLESRGGRVICDSPVEKVIVRGGRATGVRLRDGNEVPARRAVLADVVAPLLYGGLVGWDHLPGRFRDDMRRFQWDHATVKVDWALSTPVPWSAGAAYGAGTVHLAASMDEMTAHCAQIAMGEVPARPFVLMGQMTTSDPHRSPPGTEALWGYTHVPHKVRGDAGDQGLSGTWDDRELDVEADRIEEQIERYAPGFRTRIVARHVMGPPQLAAHNANLVGGAINGGTAAIHQQLMFRPTPGLGRSETPIAGLFLASSSAHPGGGVHGACGANAARAALHRAGRSRELVTTSLLTAAQRALSAHPK